MKPTSKDRKSIVAGLVMTIVSLTSVSLTALADNNRYNEREIFRFAQRYGYQFGIREGRYDRQEGHRFDPKRNRAYRDGKYGYRDDYRHDEAYRDGFRDGFLAGYDIGYNRYNNWRRDNDYDRRRYEYGNYDFRRDRDF